MNSRRGRAKRMVDTEQGVRDFESQESEPQQHSNPRDYFTLKMKANKQGKKDKDQQRDEDPITLLQHYTNQNYKKQIDLIKQYVQHEKPFHYQNPELEKFIQLGANVCFYGFGSKKNFLMEVARRHFSDNYIWEVKGYLSTIHTKKVYNNFGEFLKRAHIVEQIKKITQKEQLEEYEECLRAYYKKKTAVKQIVVVFHCLDGPQFMDVEAQKSLACLFSLPGVRLLCSIDNIKISIFWHPKVKQAYKFLFFHVSTSVPNVEQQKYKPVTTERTYQVEQSLMNICQCLNSNQKNILKILAKNELENLNRQHHINYTISELLEICIDEVILQDDAQLRDNLLELLDHKVLIEKMDEVKNRKVLLLKYEKKLLQKIMDLKAD